MGKNEYYMKIRDINVPDFKTVFNMCLCSVFCVCVLCSVFCVY